MALPSTKLTTRELAWDPSTAPSRSAWAGEPVAERDSRAKSATRGRPRSLALTPSSSLSTTPYATPPGSLMASRPASGASAKMSRPSSAANFATRVASDLTVQSIGATPIIIAGLPGQYTGHSTSLPMLGKGRGMGNSDEMVSKSQLVRLQEQNRELEDSLQRAFAKIEEAKAREAKLQSQYELEAERFREEAAARRKAHETELATVRAECERKLAASEERFGATLEGKMVRLRGSLEAQVRLHTHRRPARGLHEACKWSADLYVEACGLGVLGGGCRTQDGGCAVRQMCVWMHASVEHAPTALVGRGGRHVGAACVCCLGMHVPTRVPHAGRGRTGSPQG